MDLLIAPDGAIRCISAEEIDLSSFGKLAIQRASHVESTASGDWTVDLSPVGGPVLGEIEDAHNFAGMRAAWSDARTDLSQKTPQHMSNMGKSLSAGRAAPSHR